MADKTITQLNLADEITADQNIPADDGVETFRITTAQLKAWILATGNILLGMLEPTIFTGLTAVTPADDDFFPFVDVSDANKTKKGLVGSFRNLPYTTKSSTATLTSANEVVTLSGSSFTVTLPANGTNGKKIKLIHAGTSLTQKYTVATQGGATIGGVASGSFVLCTKGEILGLIDNGTNWVIIERNTNMLCVDLGPMSIDADVTAPTKGTASIDKVLLSRDGEFAQVDYLFNTTGSGGSDGSGEYIFGFPTGILADTSLIPAYTASALSHGQIAAFSPSLIGYGHVSQDGNARGQASCILTDTDGFKVIIGAVYVEYQAMNNGYFNFSGSLGFSYRVRFPVSDWQP